MTTHSGRDLSHVKAALCFPTKTAEKLRTDAQQAEALSLLLTGTRSLPSHSLRNRTETRMNLVFIGLDPENTQNSGAQNLTLLILNLFLIRNAHCYNIYMMMNHVVQDDSDDTTFNYLL